MKNTILAFGMALLAAKSLAAPAALDHLQILERSSEAADVSAFRNGHRAGAVRIAPPGGPKFNFANFQLTLPQFQPASATKNEAWFGGAYTGIDVIDKTGKESGAGVEAGFSWVVTRDAQGKITRNVTPYIFYPGGSYKSTLGAHSGDDVYIILSIKAPRQVIVGFYNLATNQSDVKEVYPTTNIVGNTYGWTFSSAADGVKVAQFSTFSFVHILEENSKGTQGSHPVDLFNKNGKELVAGSVPNNATVKVTYAGP